MIVKIQRAARRFLMKRQIKYKQYLEYLELKSKKIVKFVV